MAVFHTSLLNTKLLVSAIKPVTSFQSSFNLKLNLRKNKNFVQKFIFNNPFIMTLSTSSQKPHLLLLGDIDHAKKEWEQLSSIARLSVADPKLNREEFFKNLAPGGKYSDLVGIYRTFNSVEFTGRFDQELLSHLPSTFKFIAHNGAGYDQIDANSAAKLNIQVSNVPETADNATADTAVFLILGALRNFSIAQKVLRENKWREGIPLAHDPEDKVLGILGMGGIGQAVHDRVKPFGMKVQYHNRKRLDPSLERGAKYVSYDELLATSDVISLNLPLNPHTKHIINKDAFAKMKDGVVIVNTARGGVINEAELVDALNSGKVSSVGLDVFEYEPKISEGLLKNPNVLLLPHLGTYTYETQYKMELRTLNNLKAGIETGSVRDAVPEWKAVHSK